MSEDRDKKAERPGPATPAPAVPTTPPTQPTGPAAPAGNPLRKWYFCANERGLRSEFRLIRAAVASARRNTTLLPHLIYDGGEREELDWLRGAGVTVVRHRSALSEELRAGYGTKYDIFSGHWLRLDLPVVETEDSLVLYTDIDVIFLRDPRAFAFSPAFAAVCEESRLGDRKHFNSGVMVMNLQALRAVRPAMLEAVRQRLADDFQYPPHDQRSLNAFLIDRVDWMPPEWNWKPYWGTNPGAVVAHFHGPKPWHVAAIREGRAEGMKPAFRTLHDRNPEGYDAFIAAHDVATAAAEELVP